MLAADRVFLLRRFFFRYTDPDQALLWYSAREYAEGFFREPSFPGQSYLSSGEALLAAPLLRVGVQPYHALPIASVGLITVPWVLLLLAAWRRKAWLAGLVIAALPLTLTNEFSMLGGIPHGLTPGIFVATLAVFFGLAPSKKPAGLLLAGLLAGLAFGLNQTSALLTAPLVAYLMLGERRAPRWLLAGLALGGGYLVFNQYFYSTHPAYRFHPDPKFAYSREALTEAFLHLGRHLGYLGFWFLKSPVVAVAALALPATALIASRRRAHALAGAAAVALPLASLGLDKAADGTSSVFFSYTRLYIALPYLSAVLFVLASEVWAPRWKDRTLLVTALSITVLAVVSFAGRTAEVGRDVDRAIAVNETFPIIPADPVPKILEECRMLSRIVESSSVKLVVYGFNSTAPYACGTLGYEKFETLNPRYERRTWRLLEERRTQRRQMLIVGAGNVPCDIGTEHLSRCDPVPGTDPLAVRASFRQQPVTELLPKIGIDVRNF
ncbi:MAG TPA: hypothetical protein VHJ40_01380 [Actinomycetota bacterium]|nr:hypothetical protein [Actinomycetota bacterium]